jgi:hypothetical protein
MQTASILVGLGTLLAATVAFADPPTYNADIRAILSENCFVSWPRLRGPRGWAATRCRRSGDLRARQWCAGGGAWRSVLE